MKMLEIIFLILTFAVPLFFIFIAGTSLKKIKRNKKYRTRLIFIILVSFLINGSIWLVFHNINKTNINEPEVNEKEKEDGNQDLEKDKDDFERTSKGFKIEVIDGVTYIGGYLIVNKTYPLNEDFIPKGTHKEAPATGICQECIDENAYKKFIEMKNDAIKENLNLWIASGYRSYSYQGALYNGYVNRQGKDVADTFSARPGHSEHQSGLAFDLNSVNDAFASTKEGIWVANNCYKYGFIIRYPKGKDNETGYKYESWHLRYIGEELATILYNNGDWITLESYFGITSEYAN